MASDKIEFKSPSFPLFKGGILSEAVVTPLWQRGEGEIFGRNDVGVIQSTLMQNREHSTEQGPSTSAHKDGGERYGYATEISNNRVGRTNASANNRERHHA